MSREVGPDPLDLTGKFIEGTTYRVEGLVGEGGFGSVYAAYDTNLDRKVALKVLRVPSTLSVPDEERMRASFVAEGRLLARLSHANTVRVFACGYHGALPFLALEWLDGTTLTDAFAAYQEHAERLSEIHTLDLLLPVIEALAEAHGAGVIHRDIKPDNLFIARRPARPAIIKVLDFGVGKLTELEHDINDLSTDTRSGRVAFTPAYGAPEQFFPKQYGSTGPWTDVHALGLIMFELCTGEAAYCEEGPELFVEATHPNRPSPRTRGFSVSDAFEQLCLRCVALEPKHRFQNASELLDAARAVRRGLGASSTEVPLLQAPGDMAWVLPRRGRRLPYVAAALTVSAVGAALAFPRSDPTAPSASMDPPVTSHPSSPASPPSAPPATPPKEAREIASAEPRKPQKACGDRKVDTQDINYGCAEPGCQSCWIREGLRQNQSLWACIGPPGEERCSARTCAGGEFADCSKPRDGVCETVIDNDPNNCGDCGVVCEEHAPDGTLAVGCADGKCEYACQPGREDCDADFENGCEIVLASSVRHCGACGTDCTILAGPNSEASCQNGQCAVACHPGFGDCDGYADTGCEQDLSSSVAHCGACEKSCPPGGPHTVSRCIDGACSTTCESGFGDCNERAEDGCEALLTTVEHCGACENACILPSESPGAAPACKAGECTMTCKPGFIECAEGCCTTGVHPVIRDQ